MKVRRSSICYPLAVIRLSRRSAGRRVQVRSEGSMPAHPIHCKDHGAGVKRKEVGSREYAASHKSKYGAKDERVSDREHRTPPRNERSAPKATVKPPNCSKQ